MPTLPSRDEHTKLLAAAPTSWCQPTIPELRGTTAAGPAAGVAYPLPAVTHHSGVRARCGGGWLSSASLGGLPLLPGGCRNILAFYQLLNTWEIG